MDDRDDVVAVLYHEDGGSDNGRAAAAGGVAAVVADARFRVRRVSAARAVVRDIVTCRRCRKETGHTVASDVRVEGVDGVGTGLGTLGTGPVCPETGLGNELGNGTAHWYCDQGCGGLKRQVVVTESDLPGDERVAPATAYSGDVLDTDAAKETVLQYAQTGCDPRGDACVALAHLVSDVHLEDIATSELVLRALESSVAIAGNDILLRVLRELGPPCLADVMRRATQSYAALESLLNILCVLGLAAPTRAASVELMVMSFPSSGWYVQLCNKNAAVPASFLACWARWMATMIVSNPSMLFVNFSRASIASQLHTVRSRLDGDKRAIDLAILLCSPTIDLRMLGALLALDLAPDTSDLLSTPSAEAVLALLWPPSDARIAERTHPKQVSSQVISHWQVISQRVANERIGYVAAAVGTVRDVVTGQYLRDGVRHWGAMVVLAGALPDWFPTTFDRLLAVDDQGAACAVQVVFAAADSSISLNKPQTWAVTPRPIELYKLHNAAQAMLPELPSVIAFLETPFTCKHGETVPEWSLTAVVLRKGFYVDGCQDLRALFERRGVPLTIVEGRLDCLGASFSQAPDAPYRPDGGQREARGVHDPLRVGSGVGILADDGALAHRGTLGCFAVSGTDDAPVLGMLTATCVAGTARRIVHPALNDIPPFRHELNPPRMRPLQPQRLLFDADSPHPLATLSRQPDLPNECDAGHRSGITFVPFCEPMAYSPGEFGVQDGACWRSNLLRLLDTTVPPTDTAPPSRRTQLFSALDQVATAPRLVGTDVRTLRAIFHSPGAADQPDQDLGTASDAGFVADHMAVKVGYGTGVSAARLSLGRAVYTCDERVGTGSSRVTVAVADNVAVYSANHDPFAEAGAGDAGSLVCRWHYENHTCSALGILTAGMRTTGGHWTFATPLTACAGIQAVFAA